MKIFPLVAAVILITLIVWFFLNPAVGITNINTYR